MRSRPVKVRIVLEVEVRNDAGVAIRDDRLNDAARSLVKAVERGLSTIDAVPKPMVLGDWEMTADIYTNVDLRPPVPESIGR